MVNQIKRRLHIVENRNFYDVIEIIENNDYYFSKQIKSFIYLNDAVDFIEDAVPANSVSGGGIAGVVGEPPVRKKRKIRLLKRKSPWIS